MVQSTSTNRLVSPQDYLDQVQNRTKEKRYTFDVAFDPGVRMLPVRGGMEPV